MLAKLSSIEAWVPFPIPNIAITEATPITIPKIVKKERSLFANKLFIPSTNEFQKLIAIPP
jgi:hypothetical protein